MRIHSILPMLTAALVVAVFSSDAAAMYHPGLGGFLQRDPNGQQLGPSAGRVGNGGTLAAASGFIPQDDYNPMRQYTDGMNTYRAYHVMHGGVAPTGLER